MWSPLWAQDRTASYGGCNLQVEQLMPAAGDHRYRGRSPRNILRHPQSGYHGNSPRINYFYGQDVKTGYSRCVENLVNVQPLFVEKACKIPRTMSRVIMRLAVCDPCYWPDPVSPYPTRKICYKALPSAPDSANPTVPGPAVNTDTVDHDMGQALTQCNIILFSHRCRTGRMQQ